MADRIEDFEVNSPRWLSLEDFEGEVWKDITDFEGLYSVSNCGRVKSHNNYFTMKNRWGSITTRKKNGTIIKVNFRRGYPVICLHYYGKTIGKTIHRLVATAFLPNPLNKSDIDHINTITSDNRVVNLRWATRSENMLNPISNMRQKIVQGEPVVVLNCWGEYVTEFISSKEAARHLKISDTVIFEAIKRNRSAVSVKGFLFILKKNYNPDKSYKLFYKYNTGRYCFVPSEKIIVAFRDDKIFDVFYSSSDAAKFYGCHPSWIKGRIHKCNIGKYKTSDENAKIPDYLKYYKDLDEVNKQIVLKLFRQKYPPPNLL